MKVHGRYLAPKGASFVLPGSRTYIYIHTHHIPECKRSANVQGSCIGVLLLVITCMILIFWECEWGFSKRIMKMDARGRVSFWEYQNLVSRLTWKVIMIGGQSPEP